MSEPTIPDNRTEALPHEHADVSANVPPAKLVLDEIRSTRNAWTLCKAGKLRIDYVADAKNLLNLFDERIGAPPKIVEVRDEQQARMALRLMEDALRPAGATATLAEADSKSPKRKRRRRANRTPKKLTAKQMEAAQLYGELKGDFTAVGGRMGISRQAAEKHYKLAMKKLGKKVLPKARTQSLPKDKRGQETV